MFALLRRYLRRVDELYLALCAACSAVSVVVLVSIGQTQLGSNNKASVQPSPSARPWQNAVLPAPSPPVNAMSAPPGSVLANSRPAAMVSSRE